MITLNHTIPLKLSFTNIKSLHLNLVQCESFFESNTPDILALCETNLDDSIDSCSFSVRTISFNLKGFSYSYALFCSSCEGKTSFCTGVISKKTLQILTYVFN